MALSNSLDEARQAVAASRRTNMEGRSARAVILTKSHVRLAAVRLDGAGRRFERVQAGPADCFCLNRVAMTGKTPTACALLVAAISKSLAADAESLLRRMPSSYSGTHVREHSGETWYAALTFTSRHMGEDGDAIFEGVEDMRSQDGAASFKTGVRAVVNAQTFAFEMSEIHDGSKPGFPPRVYTGKITPDLNAIHARWEGSGGTLLVHLTAE